MDLWLKRLALVVVPAVRGDIPAVDEHRARFPVLRLARQKVAPLEQQDLLTRRREAMRERAAAGTGPDDDHVVPIGHGLNMPSARKLHITQQGWCHGADRQER